MDRKTKRKVETDHSYSKPYSVPARQFDRFRQDPIRCERYAIILFDAVPG